MMRIFVAFILMFLWIPLVSLNAAGLQSVCDLNNDDAAMVSDDTFQISFKSDPLPISVSKPFVLYLLICSAEGIPYEGDLKIDATMPLHKHGMNFTPTIRQVSPGSFEATGMMFHMPGTWRYQFTLKQNGHVKRLVSDTLLK